MRSQQLASLSAVQENLTLQPFIVFFAKSERLLIVVFSTSYLLYNSRLMLMQIGLSVWILGVPPQDGLCFLGSLLSRGNGRSKPESPNPLLKKTIALCRLQVAKLFGFDAYFKSLEFFILVLCLFLLTTQALFGLQTIQSVPLAYKTHWAGLSLHSSACCFWYHSTYRSFY